MNRKAILCLALVTLLPVLAAQCVVPATPESVVEEVVVTEEVAAPAEVEAPSDMDFSDVTLNFIGWQGYEDPEAFQPLYDDTGMKLNATYPSNLEEVISLYQVGGAGSYDIGVGMNRYIMLMKDLDILEPLDESKLPNLEQMLPAFKDPDWWGRIDGELYAVPAFVGFDTLCYNADQVSEPDWLFWQEEEYKGRYGVINNPLGSLYLWAMMLDKTMDAREWTQDDLAEIKAMGKEIYSDALTLVAGEGEASDLLARGDIIAHFGCNTGIAARAREAGANVVAVVPEGRTKMWADFYFIYKGSGNVDAAHTWLNHAIAAPTMAIETTKMGYNPPNEKTYELIDPELAEKLNWPGVNEFIENAPLSVLPDPDAEPPQVTLDDMYKAYDEGLATIQ
jgi:spermidine/putrescine transport system substrate-binding protein